MSRRNRDYSILSSEERGGRYHSVTELGVSAGIRLGVAVVVLAVGACVERIGDMIVQRDDMAAYDDDSRARAQDYAAEVMAAGHVLVIDIDEKGAQNIPRVKGRRLRSRFDTALVNAEKPGGQPSNKASTDPNRYDLEWNGFASNNNDAPDRNCITLELPSGTTAVMAWQASDERATLELIGGEQGELYARACQYGEDQVPEHHEVAVMATTEGR